MNFEQILAELKSEREQIDCAIAALNGISTKPKRGRPPEAIQTLLKPKGAHRMSAAGRKRISQAAKLRWAAWRQKRKAKAA